MCPSSAAGLLSLQPRWRVQGEWSILRSSGEPNQAQPLTNDSEDPLPAYMFASWLSFLIPAAYISVHAPDAITHSVAGLMLAFDRPLPSTNLLTVIRSISTVGLLALGAVLFSGYLIYALSPPATGSRIPTYLLALGTCALCFLIYPFSAWVWGGVWRTNMANGSFLFFAWLLYLLFTVKTHAGLEKRYVLFLRRFDSFADLSILPNLLKLTPRGVPVATLVSGTENEIGYWDPVKLTAYGLHATGWYGGRPAFLRGGEQWEKVVSDLVDGASVIVLDKSDISLAIAQEMKAVARSERPLILISEGENRGDLGEQHNARSTRIAYHRDRRHLVVRIAIVLSIVAAVAYLVDLPDQIREKALQGDLWEGLFGAAIMLAFAAAVAGGLLLRKGLSRTTQVELREALRAALAQPR